MRIGFWDLETSNLKADFGQLLCGVVGEYSTEWPDDPILHTLELPNFDWERWNDHELAVMIRDKLETYDLIISYNGRRFDEPFLNTRLAEVGERPVQITRHKDLLYVMRSRFRLHSNRLEVVERQFAPAYEYDKRPKRQIPKHALKATGKTRLEPVTWRKALCGDDEAYQYIVEHCQRDVVGLCRVWNKVRPVLGVLK